MVGYISKYLSYTQSCVGCIGRLVYSSKKLASGVARSIQKGLCVTVSFCRSTRFDYRSIQKGVCVTVSMDYRELTTQSIILSFYTLRLPVTAQELRRDCSSIDMWKPEWVWGDRVKQLIATWSLRTLFHLVRHRGILCLWAIFRQRLQDN